MSKVDYQRSQKREKDEEEQKKQQESKVVGQQQKTQSSANKPTGTTSIPRDNRQRNEPQRQTGREDIVGRNTVTANKGEQRQNRTDNRSDNRQTVTGQQGRRTQFTDFSSNADSSRRNTGTWGYNKTVDDARSRYAMDKRYDIPGASQLPRFNDFQALAKQTKQENTSSNANTQPMGSGISQIGNIGDYANSNANFDFRGKETIDSRKEAEKELENILFNRDKKREDAMQDTSAGTSFLSGAGSAALGTLGDLVDLTMPLTQNKPTEGMTPDQIYERAMNTKPSLDNIYGNNIQSDYNAYKDYVLDQMSSGAVTPDEIQKMKDLEDKFSGNPAHYLSELGKDARAINEGLSEGHKISNIAGNMVPMMLANAGFSTLAAPAVAGAEKIASPVARFAATQGANLIPDLMVDTIPEAVRNINEGKSADEVIKDAALNVGMNEAANLGFEYAPKALKGLIDTFNGSNVAKQAAGEVVPEAAQQMAKNAPSDLIGPWSLPTADDVAKNADVMNRPDISNAIPTPDDLLPRAAEKQTAQRMIPEEELIQDIAQPQKPQIANDTVETTDDLWAQLSGQKPINEAGVRRVGEGTPYNEQGQKLSKLHTTLENTDKLTDEEKKIFADKNGFWYDPDNEKVLAAQAQDSVARDIDEVYRQYTGDDIDIGKLGGADAHKMFTASYDYSRMAQEAVKNGDQAAADLYNQKARNIMLNAREAATKGGQFNAAIRYYANTPQGIINKAYDVLDKDITKFKTNNPKLSGSIDEVSKQLAGRLKGIDTDAIMTGTDEAAKENLRSQVINALDEISKNTKNKTLQSTLSDLSSTEIDALINSKYAGDIAKQIDMFSMGAFGIKPETLDKVLDIFDEAEKYNINSKDYYNLEQQAYTLLANDLGDGKGFKDKVDAWRYFSMLSAPLTHIRNMVGNTQNNILTGLKNNLSAAIEAAADRVTKASGGLEGGRTKSILNALDSADRSLIKLSGDDFDNNAYRQFKQAGNKYINVERNLANAGDVWKDKGLGKVLNKLTGANEYLLDAEDTLFGKAKYQTSLAGFLKANGADSGIFNATDDASKELLTQAREYALKQANEATFHQSNAFANWWSQGVKNLRDSDKAGMRALGNAANASMPFVKTPSNILAQGWEYSPAEFINVAADTMSLKKGTMKGTEYIDKLSKALTGTGMVGFGALLAHEGIISIGNGDEDENNFNEKRGIKRLALHVGDNYIDISQLAPSAIPLLEGAVMYETMKNNKDGNGAGAVDTIFTGLATIGNTVTDMTLLKGISDIMSAARYSDNAVDMAAQVGTKIAGNYASQMLPTLGAKAEQTIDDTKRTSYTDKQGTFSRAFDQQGRYLKTKIPFAQELGEKLEQSDNEKIAGIGDMLTNEPKIDPWGNEVKVQDYGNGALGRFANNFLNPLETTTDQHDRVDEELRNLYDEVKDPKVLSFGTTDSKEATINGEKMTDKQWTQYQKTIGSLKHELAESFMDSEEYNGLDAETKAEAYNKLKGFAKAYSLNDMGIKEPSNANQVLIDAYKEGGAGVIIDSVIGKSTAEAAGVRSNSAAAAEIQESIESGDTEGAQKKADAAQQLKDAGLGRSGPQQAYYDALEGNPDLTVEQFAETYKMLDANGNQTIAQGEFIDYLNANHVSEKDAEALIKDYYPKDKTKIPTLEDGTWKAKKPEQGATQSQTVTNNKTGSYTGSKADIKLDNPTGNATMDAKLKAKQAMREDAKAKRQQSINDAEALPSANYDIPSLDSSWTVNVGGKTYDLHDSKGYQKSQSLGIPDATWLKMYKETDTNGNGRNTKGEASAYIEQLVQLGMIDKSQRADYFDMLIGTKAKNPYR